MIGVERLCEPRGCSCGSVRAAPGPVAPDEAATRSSVLVWGMRLSTGLQVRRRPPPATGREHRRGIVSPSSWAGVGAASSQQRRREIRARAPP